MRGPIGDREESKPVIDRHKYNKHFLFLHSYNIYFYYSIINKVVFYLHLVHRINHVINPYQVRKEQIAATSILRSTWKISILFALFCPRFGVTHCGALLFYLFISLFIAIPVVPNTSGQSDINEYEIIVYKH